MAVKRSRKCSGFVIFWNLKETSFASSLKRGCSSKAITPTLRTTSPRQFGAPAKKGDFLWKLIIMSIMNCEKEKWRWWFKIKFLRLTSAFLSTPNCFTFAETFSVYTAGVHTTKTMSSAVSQGFWNKNVLKPAWHTCQRFRLIWALLSPLYMKNYISKKCTESEKPGSRVIYYHWSIKLGDCNNLLFFWWGQIYVWIHVTPRQIHNSLSAVSSKGAKTDFSSVHRLAVELELLPCFAFFVHPATDIFLNMLSNTHFVYQRGQY